MNKASQTALMLGKIALCVFIIANQLRGDKSYDLMLVFLVIMLAETIPAWQKEKRRENTAMLAGLVFAFVGITILYICSFFE